VPRVDYDKLSSDRLGEPSEHIRARVEVAREIQTARFDGTRMTCNADMGPAEIREYCPVDQAGKALLRAAMQQLQMSARAYHRILKLSRTIADPSIGSGQAWRGVSASRRRTWRRRSSTGRGGSTEQGGGET
jgi:magnesium chelatase family protein